MNNLRKVMGRSRLQQSLKNAARYKTDGEYVAAARRNNELTSKWLHRLRATAVTNESREQHSQLAAILDYYNREAFGVRSLEKIDWDQFEKDTHTPNVVSKVKSKYEDFMAAEFLVDGIVQKCGTRSEGMKNLDIAMHYNYNLWMQHYLMHLDQMETLHNIGDVT